MPLTRLLTAGVLLLILASGCATQTQDEAEVVSTEAALTLEECDDQLDACFAANPFFGLFTCPAQHRQCRLTAEDGLPAQVIAAIADAAACVDEGRDCRADTFRPTEDLACLSDEAWCLAGIVGIEPPQIVTGTVECVEDLAACIRSSESASDLNQCGDDYRECALEVVVDTLPPELEATFEDLSNCRFLRGECTDEANTPGELAQCAEDHLMCVGEVLDVDFPDPPVAEALQCGEAAAACAFAATSLGDLVECRSDLRECVASAVLEELTCEQEWTQCLAANPFLFLSCTAEFAVCSD